LKLETLKRKVYHPSHMQDYTELSYQTPLFSIRARGKWRDQVVFEVLNGKQYHRVLTDYDRSAKPHLVRYQPKFAAGVHAWQALGPEQKRWYTSRAAKLGKQLAGYHYYLSLYLKDKL